MRAAVRKPAPAHAGDIRNMEVNGIWQGKPSAGQGGRRPGRQGPGAVLQKRRALREAQLVEDARLVTWRPRGALSAGDRSLIGENWRGGSGGREYGLCQTAMMGRVRAQGLPCPLGAENAHLWQMCSQLRLLEFAEAVIWASALGWWQFLQVDEVGAWQDQPGLGRKGPRGQLPGHVY